MDWSEENDIMDWSGVEEGLPVDRQENDIMDWSEENDIMDWSEENGIMVWSEENGNTDPEVNLGFVFQHSFACFFLS